MRTQQLEFSAMAICTFVMTGILLTPAQGLTGPFTPNVKLVLLMLMLVW